MYSKSEFFPFIAILLLTKAGKSISYQSKSNKHRTIFIAYSYPRIIGSKPAPSFEFSIGGRVLPSGEGRLFLEEDESPASLVTVATLRFTPAAEDDGARAACAARNRHFPAADEKEDGYRISVTCE